MSSKWCQKNRSALTCPLMASVSAVISFILPRAPISRVRLRFRTSLLFMSNTGSSGKGQVAHKPLSLVLVCTCFSTAVGTALASARESKTNHTHSAARLATRSSRLTSLTLNRWTQSRNSSNILCRRFDASSPSTTLGTSRLVDAGSDLAKHSQHQYRLAPAQHSSDEQQVLLCTLAKCWMETRNTHPCLHRQPASGILVFGPSVQTTPHVCDLYGHQPHPE